MKRQTIISMEQALSLTYATLRFVQLGWRVIRLEATPGNSSLPGDPNRYIGDITVDDDRRSYFIAPNVGKEAIALNLKTQRGRDLLKTLITTLDVDVFCCNTLPSRYQSLGIDYQSLKAVKPDIIWAGISAMGPEYPDTPGYDPAIQAMAGYMELTGAQDGPPMLSGIPITDLKAGDEVYAGVCLALAERAESGKGCAIHVSMLQAAASWLITTLPLLDFDCDPSEVTRCGNEHRKFIPVNVYAAQDGFILIAIGNDGQWQRLTQLAAFKSLNDEGRLTNEGRHNQRQAIHHDMSRVVCGLPIAELQAILKTGGIPHAPIQTIPQVRATPAVESRLTKTHQPDGKVIHLPPPAVTLEETVTEYAFPPRYNQDTASVLREAGLTDPQIAELAAEGVIP